MLPPGHQPLEGGRRVVGDDPAAVEECDRVGELVGLLEVLGREEHRDAVGDEGAHVVPQGAPAARVQPGGRLVEEDDPRPRHQGHGQVEASEQAAGELGAAGVGVVAEVELLDELVDPGTGGVAAEAAQVGDEPEVLADGEELVDGRELAGDPDEGAHGIRLAGDVVAADEGGAAVGGGERRRGCARSWSCRRRSGPSTASTEPAGAVRSTPSRTSRSPKDLRRPLTSIAAGREVVMRAGPFGHGGSRAVGAWGE